MYGTLALTKLDKTQLESNLVLKQFPTIDHQEAESWDEVHLDIGCGSGGFLEAAARQHPRNLYIGVDINPQIARNLAHRLEQTQLLNTRVVHGEAVEYMRHNIDDNSISDVHIYFPTPEKIKLDESLGLDHSNYDVVINEHCFAECQRILRPTGHLRIITDYRKHFHKASVLARKFGFSWVPWSNHLNKRPSIYMIETYWEQLAVDMDVPIHRAKFIP